MSVNMTKQKAQELARKAYEHGEKYGLPAKEKYDLPIKKKKRKQKK